MKRRGNLLGLPVVAVDTGRKIGEVEEVLFDARRGRVLGFLLEGGGWLTGYRYVPLARTSFVGRDALTVKTDRGSVERVWGSELRKVFNLQKRLLGKRVFSPQGGDLGVIDDVVFTADGRIRGFQLSGGFLEDWLRGKEFLPLRKGLTVGPDAIIVGGYRENREKRTRRFSTPRRRVRAKLRRPHRPPDRGKEVEGNGFRFF